MHKHSIFESDQDRLRFLFTLLHFQSPVVFNNISYDVKNFTKAFFKGHSVLTKKELVEEINISRTVELLGFALMPNHFHLIIKEVLAGGISTFMQRV